MLPALLLAAATAGVSPAPLRPPDGKYTYSVILAGAPIGGSTIAIDSSSGAIVVTEHAAMSLPKYTASTTMRYDPSTLRETAYSADFQLAAGPQHTDVAIKPGLMTVTVPAGSVDIPAATPETLELIGDNLIGSGLLVPAIVNATHATSFTLAVLSVGKPLAGTILSDTPARPPAVAAGDAVISVQFAGIREDFWYDPATYVVHEIAIPAQQAEFRLTSTVALGAAAPTPVPAPTALPTPFPHFISTDVHFTSRDGTVLAGTLTVPDRGRGPFPAVVLVHGSGAENRDEAIGPNPVFLQLSNALSNAGYVVLRYDKRGVEKSGGSPLSGTRENLIADVSAALQFTAAQRAVDAEHVFLLGHSEGAELVPSVAARRGGIAGLILLAPPAAPLWDILVQQAADIAPTDKRESARRTELQQIERIRHSTEPRDKVLASLFDIDPITDIKRVRVPILMLQGLRDDQVRAADLPRLVNAARAVNRDVTVRTFTNDNHLFEAAIGDDGNPVSAMTQYLTVPARIDRRVLDTITTWLAKEAR
jgi:dienelactone hydrolase